MCVLFHRFELMGKFEIRLKVWKIRGKIGWFHCRLFRCKRSKILLCSSFDLCYKFPERLCCITEILLLKVHMLVRGLVYNDLRMSENLVVVVQGLSHGLISPNFGFQIT